MFLITVATCILALSGFVQCEAESKPNVEGGVLVLTQANFPTVLKETEFVLVEFCKYYFLFHLPVSLEFVFFFSLVSKFNSIFPFHLDGERDGDIIFSNL